MLDREKRNERRAFFSTTIRYTYTAGTNGSRSEHTVAAITSNRSEGGVGMFTDRRLIRGQRLRLGSERHGDFNREAVVRWCVPVSRTLYRVGVMFEGAALAA